jgi:hypothetical protein
VRVACTAFPLSTRAEPRYARTSATSPRRSGLSLGTRRRSDPPGQARAVGLVTARACRRGSGHTKAPRKPLPTPEAASTCDPGSTTVFENREDDRGAELLLILYRPSTAAHGAGRPREVRGMVSISTVSALECRATRFHPPSSVHHTSDTTPADTTGGVDRQPERNRLVRVDGRRGRRRLSSRHE